MSKIITATELNSYTSKTLDSAVAGFIVDALDGYVDRETSRSFGELQTVTETYDYRGLIWLRHMDITEIVSVKLGFPGQSPYEVPADGYRFNPLGRLRLNGRTIDAPVSYDEIDYVEVTYKYGFTKLGYTDSPANTAPRVPADLKHAALAIAAGFYNYATEGQREVLAASIDGYREEYAGRTDQASSGKNTRDSHFSVISGYAMQRV